MSAGDTPEFSHMVDLRGITVQPVRLDAGEDTRAALDARSGIVAVERL